MIFQREITVESNEVITRMRGVLKASFTFKVAIYSLLMTSNHNVPLIRNIRVVDIYGKRMSP